MRQTPLQLHHHNLPVLSLSVFCSRPGAGAQLLTSSTVQDISARGTSTLAQLQQLFTYHMIQNFGCDYSSSGLELDNLRSKVIWYTHSESLFNLPS